MIYKYNAEKLKKVIWDFHNATGMSVGILDSELNWLARYPEPLARFCQLIHTSEEGSMRCYESDIRLFARCIESRCAETHTCHAGLADTAVPIYNNEMLLGFIIFGQVGWQSERKKPFASIQKNVSDLGLDKAELKKAYDELDFFAEDKIRSAAEIVVMLTKYIMLENIIQPDYDNNIEKIVEYIDVNITEELSVSFLCRHFNISKNTLYAMFNSQFECGVKEYINARRISRAEQLLKTTDLPIYQVCEKCGIENYQYFCRLFKKTKHITPLQYKKSWRSGQNITLSGEDKNV